MYFIFIMKQFPYSFHSPAHPKGRTPMSEPTRTHSWETLWRSSTLRTNSRPYPELKLLCWWGLKVTASVFGTVLGTRLSRYHAQVFLTVPPWHEHWESGLRKHSAQDSRRGGWARQSPSSLPCAGRTEDCSYRVPTGTTKDSDQWNRGQWAASFWNGISLYHQEASPRRSLWMRAKSHKATPHSIFF